MELSVYQKAYQTSPDSYQYGPWKFHEMIVEPMFLLGLGAFKTTATNDNLPDYDRLILPRRQVGYCDCSH